MKTDIEIAQEAQMVHVKEVAAKLDITEEELDLYGKYKAKLSDELIRLRQEREKRQSVSDLERHLDSLGKKQSLHFVSHPLDRVLVSKAELQVVDIRRWFQWKI